MMLENLYLATDFRWIKDLHKSEAV